MYHKSNDNTTITSPFAQLETISFAVNPEHQAELNREAEMRQLGHERFKEKLDKSKSLANQKNAQNLIGQEQRAVTDYLNNIIAEQSNPNGRQFSWIHKVVGIDTQTLAVLALSIMFDAVSQQAQRTPTITKLGKAVEMEQWALWLRDKDKALEKRVYNKVMREHTNYRYRKTAMKAIVGKAAKENEWDDVPDEWTSGSDDTECTKVGSLLYNAVLSSTNLFECWEDVTTKVRNNKATYKTIYRIGLQGDAADRIESMNDESSWLEPMFGPMCVPPVEWKRYRDLKNTDPTKREAGVYLDAALGGLVPLVRGANPQQREMIKQNIEDGTLAPALRALNAIQASPFEINGPILEAVMWAWDNDKSAGKFPRSKELGPLEFPPDYDDLPDKAKKRWRLKARKRHKRDKQIKGNMAQMKQDLRVAVQNIDNPFWVGASWDFRGRVYPVANFNHCRGDHIKHMITLYNKEPVGEEGAYWVAMKVADLGDFNKISKKPIADRIAWVEENREKIREVAKDYKLSHDGDDPDKLYWSKADKPFGFLAACIEFTNIMTFGIGYESGFPCGLDGANSGLQHFSSLSLNEVEGAFVGLVPSDEPADLYETVAGVVRKSIKGDFSTPHREVRDAWNKFSVGRKTVKRNVMTKNYGSNLWGFKNQILDDFMEPINALVDEGHHWRGHEVNPFEIELFDKNGESRGLDEGRTAAEYLARKSWDAVNEVVKGANEGMSFIQKLADACSAENKLMCWTTPMGFPVVNRYTKQLSKPIKVFLHDREFDNLKRTQITLKTSDNNNVDGRKASAASAANHTHSLDSNHLHATVLKCLDKYGIRDFFLIHDSFATTPARTQDMFYAVREAFIEQYEGECLYQRLKDQVVAQLDYPEKADLPEIPKKGKLDLKQIIESWYCFL